MEGDVAIEDSLDDLMGEWLSNNEADDLDAEFADLLANGHNDAEEEEDGDESLHHNDSHNNSASFSIDDDTFLNGGDHRVVDGDGWVNDDEEQNAREIDYFLDHQAHESGDGEVDVGGAYARDTDEEDDDDEESRADDAQQMAHSSPSISSSMAVQFSPPRVQSVSNNVTPNRPTTSASSLASRQQTPQSAARAISTPPHSPNAFAAFSPSTPVSMSTPYEPRDSTPRPKQTSKRPESAPNLSTFASAVASPSLLSASPQVSPVSPTSERRSHRSRTPSNLSTGSNNTPRTSSPHRHRSESDKKSAKASLSLSHSSPMTTKKYLLGWTNAQQGQLRPPLRRGHTFTQFSTFTLMFGGYNGRYLSDLWIFDCVTMRWSNFSQGKTHPSKRSGHSAVLINDKMWLFGGETEKNDCLNDIWTFDLNSKEWEKVTPNDSQIVPPPRFGHSAVAFGASMYIFGGADKSAQCYSDFWCFDTTTYTWATVFMNPCPAARHGHTLVPISPNRMLLFGGYAGDLGRMNDMWELDPFLLEWVPIEPTGKLPPRRAYHTAAVLRYKMYIFGGQGPTALADLWQFCHSSKQWRKIQVTRESTAANSQISSNVLTPAPRYGHVSTVYGGDKMIIFGGIGDSQNYRDDLWSFFIDLSLHEDRELEGSGLLMDKVSSMANEDAPPMPELWQRLPASVLLSAETREYLSAETLHAQQVIQNVTEKLHKQLRDVDHSTALAPMDATLQQQLLRRVKTLEERLENKDKELAQFKSEKQREMGLFFEQYKRMFEERMRVALLQQKAEFDKQFREFEQHAMSTISEQHSNQQPIQQNQNKQQPSQQQNIIPDEQQEDALRILRAQVRGLQEEIGAVKRSIAFDEENERARMSDIASQLALTLRSANNLSRRVELCLDRAHDDQDSDGEGWSMFANFEQDKEKDREKEKEMPAEADDAAPDLIN